MTLEELKNKKVTITINKTFSLSNHLYDDVLTDILEDYKDDEQVVEYITSTYYSAYDDLIDCLNSDDFKISIHD